MALGGEMRDHVGLEFGDRRADRVRIADVALDEAVAVRVRDALDRRQRARIGQLVEVEHFMIGVFDQMTDERRPDETGPAGDENAHGSVLQASGASGRPS
jgi:hypothetical protein